MPGSDNRAPDDRLLVRYLLGVLPDEEAEHLDELSIGDDEFAARLDALENDLVDGYVRGELPHEELIQFKRIYLSSRQRQQKVRFAEGLMALEQKASVAPVPAPGKVASSFQPREQTTRFGFSMPRFASHWALAAALSVVAVLGGFLLFQNIQLRKQIMRSQAERSSLDHLAHALEEELNQERAARAENQKAPGSGAESSSLDRLRTISVLLPPPMRDAIDLPMVDLRLGADLVVLVLPLESDDFTAYRASVKDLATNRIIWSGAWLKVARSGERRTISISLRASLLKDQHYIVDLTGMPVQGAVEDIATYPFRVMQ